MSWSSTDYDAQFQITRSEINAMRFMPNLAPIDSAAWVVAPELNVSAASHSTAVNADGTTLVAYEARPPEYPSSWTFGYRVEGRLLAAGAPPQDAGVAGDDAAEQSDGAMADAGVSGDASMSRDTAAGTPPARTDDSCSCDARQHEGRDADVIIPLLIIGVMIVRAHRNNVRR